MQASDRISESTVIQAWVIVTQKCKPVTGVALSGRAIRGDSHPKMQASDRVITKDIVNAIGDSHPKMQASDR